MNSWKLPRAIEVGGIKYDIRTDYRQIIKLYTYLNNPDYEGMETELILFGLYKEPTTIPKTQIGEAIEQAMRFLAGGELVKESGHKPRLMDWEQDAQLIIPAVNRVAGKEIRDVEYMHWWTFLGMYMEIGECSFNTVIGIRQKLAAGKKLEKWEREYYNDHSNIVNLQKKMTTEQKEKKKADEAALKALLGE